MISAVVLVVILSRVALDDLLDRAAGGALLPLALVAGLAALCFALVALRWRLVAGLLGVTMPISTAVRAQFVAMFGGQVLPSGIGIDVVRGWALAGHGKRVSSVVASLVADRLVALFAACLLALPSLAGMLGAPLFAPWLRPTWLAALLGPIAVVGSGAALTAFLFGLRRLEGATLRPGTIASAIGMALVVQATVVVMAALAASAYRIDASPGLWLSVVPASVILTSIPISLNGWGIREAAIVTLSAPLGLPTADALLVSVTLGALNLLASLPGALVFLRSRGRGLA